MHTDLVQTVKNESRYMVSFASLDMHLYRKCLWLCTHIVEKEW